MTNERAVKAASMGAKETDWEAPPSVLLRKDLWQVILFSVTEPRVNRGQDRTQTDSSAKVNLRDDLRQPLMGQLKVQRGNHL